MVAKLLLPLYLYHIGKAPRNHEQIMNNRSFPEAAGEKIPQAGSRCWRERGMCGIFSGFARFSLQKNFLSL